MEHSPRDVKPRDVEDFNPKDRKLILLIDETLADHEAYLAEDHKLALQGIANADAARWAEHDHAEEPSHI